MVLNAATIRISGLLHKLEKKRASSRVQDVVSLLVDTFAKIDDTDLDRLIDQA
jgi:hypothetical protein